MLGIHHYWLFLLTALLLVLTPGPDTFFILGRSLAGGRAAGIAAALGISAGSVAHTVLAALGLSAILATSPQAFLAVKLAGAAYLLYVGVRTFMSRSGLPGDAVHGSSLATPVASLRWAAFRQGVLSNLLNPKVALFFLALLPQFIDARSGHQVSAFLLLGFSFVTLGVVWCVLLAVAAARLRDTLLRHTGLATLLNRAAGAVFIGLGLKLATARQ